MFYRQNKAPVVAVTVVLNEFFYKKRSLWPMREELLPKDCSQVLDEELLEGRFPGQELELPLSLLVVLGSLLWPSFSFLQRPSGHS